MGDKAYRFVNWKHPGGWLLHLPFAGGKVDASDAFTLKHAGEKAVRIILDNHFFGYVVDDADHQGRNLDDFIHKLRWQPKGEGWNRNVIGYGRDNPYIPPL
mgnify:CR=1 FL=1